jgi:enamine deaminase RidA (YjgF/YER057c/UK114 family)
MMLVLLLGLSAFSTAGSQPPSDRQPSRQAVAAGGFIYLSGMGPIDASGKVVSGDVRAQTARVLDNLAALLARHRSRLEQVAAVTVYLRNQADFAAMNEAYARYWPKDSPTRTTIIVNAIQDEALVEMSMVALADGVDRRVVLPAGWVKPTSPYSYAILSGDTLFISGLVSRNSRDNSVIAGDMRAQTETVLSNAAEILKTAGMTTADVVSARAYITDTAMFQEMNAAYRAAFPVNPPARATVRAGLTAPQHFVEITLLAVRGAERQTVTTPNPDRTPGTPNPLLSSAVRMGNRLFLSGMLGVTDANRGDAAAQTRETLARIGRTLEAAGFNWSDVVDAVVYLPKAGDLSAVDAAYRGALGSTLPARTIVEAGLVSPDALVEIMVTAVKR